ncbi:uncharacterized protein CANTADRAFT_91201 [Suhomyces tanzawaensis NRRL Y-17324]|uniref:Signal peptidase complex subunit 2 n=1 Tax=Suhomyces tanzawaensis NRRL Y-17324 TaxID=984487 RepID=A0A1E4SE28_9ASCO|nr:uncharacterized protein CANTADRAFT_91201 [Suhomyces tanzawaensis NRRL Y-17324]ODV77738.1 hypothetical protein CANTADRAFT_91201 [Suhomyces tanzawaensis NRRL Y-17324]
MKKTNLNSINDLRQATDENLSSVLSEFGYDESFLLVDTKLALGYLTVIIAGLLYYLDKKYSFQELYYVNLVAVVVYFLISGALLLINRRNKDVKYVGKTSKGEKIVISGWTDKFAPEYNIRVVVNGNEKNAAQTALEFKSFFDIIGYFNRDEFAKLLKVEIEKAGKKSI